MSKQNAFTIIVVGILLWVFVINPSQTSPPPPSVTVEPPVGYNDGTVYPTVAVTTLPTGEGDTLGAAGTALPTNMPLIAIFGNNDTLAAEYWVNYHPAYSFSHISTAGAESVGVGTATYEPKYFGNNFEIPWDLSVMSVTGQTKVVLQVATSRDAVYRGLTCKVVNETTLDCTVNLEPECVTMLAIPVATEAANGSDELQLQTQAGIIDKPSRWVQPSLEFYFGYDPASVALNLGRTAETLAAQSALDTMITTDRLHRAHVKSVQERWAVSSHDTIVALAREATCSVLTQKGKSCEGMTINFSVVAAAAPDKLQWCGTGYPVSDKPYATEYTND